MGLVVTVAKEKALVRFVIINLLVKMFWHFVF